MFPPAVTTTRWFPGRLGNPSVQPAACSLPPGRPTPTPPSKGTSRRTGAYNNVVTTCTGDCTRLGSFRAHFSELPIAHRDKRLQPVRFRDSQQSVRVAHAQRIPIKQPHLSVRRQGRLGVVSGSPHRKKAQLYVPVDNTKVTKTSEQQTRKSVHQTFTWPTKALRQAKDHLVTAYHRPTRLSHVT